MVFVTVDVAAIEGMEVAVTGVNVDAGVDVLSAAFCGLS